MKKIIFFLLCTLPLLASDQSGANYDIVARTANFVLFIAILYYLVANPLKNMYTARIKKINDDLKSIQDKLLESKNKKLELLQKIEKAKEEANNILRISKQEARLIEQKLQDQLKTELLNLEKAQNHKKEYELKKLKKEVVSKVLKELFKDESFKLSHKHVLDIVFKKVA